jgi:hypothetical protein
LEKTSLKCGTDPSKGTFFFGSSKATVTLTPDGDSTANFKEVDGSEEGDIPVQKALDLLLDGNDGAFSFAITVPSALPAYFSSARTLLVVFQEVYQRHLEKQEKIGKDVDEGNEKVPKELRIRAAEYFQKILDRAISWIW